MHADGWKNFGRQRPDRPTILYSNIYWLKTDMSNPPGLSSAVQ